MVPFHHLSQLGSFWSQVLRSGSGCAETCADISRRGLFSRVSVGSSTLVTYRVFETYPATGPLCACPLMLPPLHQPSCGVNHNGPQRLSHWMGKNQEILWHLGARLSPELLDISREADPEASIRGFAWATWMESISIHHCLKRTHWDCAQRQRDTAGRSRTAPKWSVPTACTVWCWSLTASPGS